MNIDCNNRNFKLWKYNVSHPCLLIRSPKNNEFKTNIDIMFHGIIFVNIPNSFYVTHISTLSPNDDVDLIQEIINMGYDTNNVTVFYGESHKFYIIASIVIIEENEYEFFDSKI